MCYVEPNNMCTFYVFVARAFRYNRVKKNQLDAQLIPSIFRQPLHVSGVSTPILLFQNSLHFVRFSISLVS